MAPVREELLQASIGGLTPLTTVDYPGYIATVVFLRGCSWHCPYCHNESLRSFQGREGDMSWGEFLAFMDRRRSFVEAVVLSGGEPTRHQELPQLLQSLRDRKFKTGLHTAGSNPRRLAEALPWLSWVGLDIKAPLDQRYDRITGQEQSHRVVRESLALLMASGIPYQLRTTRDPQLLSEEDCRDMENQLGEVGAPKTVWQELGRGWTRPSA
ncbi:MAG: anaerobic ribonucleoside-triphosphate reductase activating protein [Blastochloris sp.]|nr:anaerobic ribonucleoside-triphosphate reductase activating protein [Blastochloris sp.]